jgi:hypothetical protein
MAVCLLLISPPLASFAQANSFDVPLKKKVVDYGPAPYYPGQPPQKKLYCYFYSTLMVKQYDTAQKGAEWLAIVPIQNQSIPPCNLPTVSGERRIGPEEWSGYFKGVGGNLVFFDAADGIVGGLPFALYDSRTGRKIFEDSAYDSRMWNSKVEDSPFNHIRLVSAQKGETTLRYLRIVGTECDLHTPNAPCWEQIKKQFALKSAQHPVCTGYKGIYGGWASSSVAYPVEVQLPQPSIKTITGQVTCWPVD